MDVPVTSEYLQEGNLATVEGCKTSDQHFQMLKENFVTDIPILNIGTQDFLKEAEFLPVFTVSWKSESNWLRVLFDMKNYITENLILIFLAFTFLRSEGSDPGNSGRFILELGWHPFYSGISTNIFSLLKCFFNPPDA